MGEVGPVPALPEQPAMPVASVQSSIFTDMFGKIKELIKERGIKATLEQLEKPENQDAAARLIEKLPEPGKSAILNALQQVIAKARSGVPPVGGRRSETSSGRRHRRRTHKRGGMNGAITQLESSHVGGAPSHVGGNLGAVQQMIANTPYSDQPITPNTVYRNPWGGRRSRRRITRRHK